MNSGQLFCHLHYEPSAFYSAPSSYGGAGPGSVIDDLDDDMLDDGLCRYVLISGPIWGWFCFNSLAIQTVFAQGTDGVGPSDQGLS